MLFIICCLYQIILLYGWVPLINLKNYPTHKPSEIEVMGKKLVIWKKDNEIIVQDNVCMHRGGPLSEGYIDPESKNLRCSYHGWEFDKNGKVLNIPQASPSCNSCKFQQKTYPTKESCHVLWVNLNKVTPSPLPNHIMNYQQEVCDDVFVVDVPYSMGILLENLFDPAHVPFAHHKLQSNRELASTVNASIQTMNESSLEIYFEDNTLRQAEYRNGTMSFYEPGHYVLTSIYPDVIIKRLHVYCVPINPFKTRIFVQNEYNDVKVKRIVSLIPSWMKHLLTHTFFDSDTMLLYKQEQSLRSRNKLTECIKTYVTPTSSDNSIHYYHKWKKMFPKPWSKYIDENANQTTTITREDVFNRYNDHTKNCVSCKGTLDNIKTIQKLLPSLLLIHSIHNNNIIETIVSILLYIAVKKLKTFFLFRDYIHNEV